MIPKKSLKSNSFDLYIYKFLDINIKKYYDMNMKFSIYILFIFIFMLIFSGCGKNNGYSESSTEFSVVPSSLTFKIGDSAELSVKSTVTNAANISWKTSDSSIIAIKSSSVGAKINIMAVNYGTATITASMDNKTAVCNIIVGDTGINYVLIYNTSPDAGVSGATGILPQNSYSSNSKSTLPRNAKSTVLKNGRTAYEIEPSSFLSDPTSEQMQSISFGLHKTGSRSVSMQDIGTSKIFSTRDYATVSAACAYRGTYCDVYIEDKYYSGFSSFDKGGNIGRKFDNSIRDFMVRNFGDYLSNGSKDTNEKIVILLEDIKDSYGSGSTSYVAGFFDSYDLYDLSGRNINNLAMIHIDITPLMGTGDNYAMYDESTSYRILVHEFQHLINFTDSVLSRHAVNHIWWNEMFSMAAEYMYDNRYNRIFDFNNDDKSIIRNGAVLTYTSYSINDNAIGANYGLPFLFGQYIRTQTKGLAGGGDSIFKTIISSGYNDYRAVTDALNKVGYTGATSFSELNKNFRIALVLKEYGGIYGFKGEYDFNNVYMPLYESSSSVTLKGSAGIVMQTEPFILNTTNNNITYFNFTHFSLY